MKKGLIYIGILSAALSMGGCTKDFENINNDPTQTGEDIFDPNYLITSGQYAFSSKGYAYNIFAPLWVQLMSSTSTNKSNYLSNGDKYVSSSSTPDYMSRIWGVNYGSTDKFSTGAGNLIKEAISLSANDPAKSNVNAVATIMKVLIMQETTDTYGDVPYSEAFQGKQGVTRPKYDTQQEIYTSMLTELETAIAQLDASKALATGDMYYKGNVDKWKRFGYSLMLRVAMRLTKVDANTAKTWAEKAAAGGTFQSSADDALVPTELATGYTNAQAKDYNTDIYQTKWSNVLIDYLRAQGDPRLEVVAEVPLATEEDGKPAAGTTGAAIQRGMPNGYDLGTIRDITTAPGYPGAVNGNKVGAYSRPRYSVYANQASPIFVLTYAETELLLAEAAVRGWSVGASAAQHYQQGVVAALTELSKLGNDLAISTTVAESFAAAHPLDVSSQAASLAQINTQYWATTGLEFNYIQSYFNWKRSGYPVLTAVNFPGNFSGATIPRRQPYPVAEVTLNAVNYKEAIGRLGGTDSWTARVWWDVAQ
jgi:hypothetical protein